MARDEEAEEQFDREVMLVKQRNDLGRRVEQVGGDLQDAVTGTCSCVPLLNICGQQSGHLRR